MITEKQVKDYLKSKDKNYIDALIDSLYEDDDAGIRSENESFDKYKAHRRYFDDEKYLGSINEMMTEVSSLIQTAREQEQDIYRGILIFFFLKSRPSMPIREARYHQRYLR